MEIIRTNPEVMSASEDGFDPFDNAQSRFDTTRTDAWSGPHVDVSNSAHACCHRRGPPRMPGNWLCDVPNAAYCATCLPHLALMTRSAPAVPCTRRTLWDGGSPSASARPTPSASSGSSCTRSTTTTRCGAHGAPTRHTVHASPTMVQPCPLGAGNVRLSIWGQ